MDMEGFAVWDMEAQILKPHICRQVRCESFVQVGPLENEPRHCC